MNIVKGTCRRCHTEKKTPKKFSAENNMDPGDVPEELKGLTEIEEMLIAQVFTVMSVYRLRGGQNGYRGNIINFPQDVHEFTKWLPRNPFSLDVLVVQRQSSNETTAYRDFYVRRDKVARALVWLKANNRYYEDIIIDNEILQSLPENGSIVSQFTQIQNDQAIDEIFEQNPNDQAIDEILGNEDEAISRTFVPSRTSTRREEVAINDTLDQMQSNNPPILWPEIDGFPINEFQTPRYIARAFPTLYPYGNGDL